MIPVEDVEKVVHEMMHCALRNERPTPDQLERWVTELSVTTLTMQSRGREQSADRLPTHVHVQFDVSRAAIETACCVPHVLGPLFHSAWESFGTALDRACWRVPAPSGKHRSTVKH